MFGAVSVCKILPIYTIIFMFERIGKREFLESTEKCLIEKTRGGLNRSY